MGNDREIYDAYWALLEQGLVDMGDVDPLHEYEDMDIPDRPPTNEEIAALPILDFDEFFKDRENNVEDTV